MAFTVLTPTYLDIMKQDLESVECGEERGYLGCCDMPVMSDSQKWGSPSEWSKGILGKWEWPNILILCNSSPTKERAEEGREGSLWFSIGRTTRLIRSPISKHYLWIGLNPSLFLFLIYFLSIWLFTVKWRVRGKVWNVEAITYSFCSRIFWVP